VTVIYDMYALFDYVLIMFLLIIFFSCYLSTYLPVMSCVELCDLGVVSKSGKNYYYHYYLHFEIKVYGMIYYMCNENNSSWCNCMLYIYQ